MAPRPDRTALPNLDDYHAARRAFALDAPTRYNPVIDIVEAWAEGTSSDMALVSLDDQGQTLARWTVEQLASAAREAALAFTLLGVGVGDRVLVMLPRCPEWYAVVLGAIRVGAVIAPAPNLLTAKDIEYRVQRARASVIVTSPDGADKVDRQAAHLPGVEHLLLVGAGERIRTSWRDWETLVAQAPSHDDALPEYPTAATDPMFLYFTSGTVSHPKMVMHTQASYSLGHVSTARYWHDLRAGDVHWTVSDTGWAKAAWGALFGQWHEGATVLQVDLARPDPDTILGILEAEAVTSFCAPPTLYRLLVQHDLTSYDLSMLRHCTSAGEPLNPEVIRAWHQGTGGLTVYDGYGQTETTNLVANYRTVPVRPGSMGKPAPGYDVDIVDEDGIPTGPGVIANIAVRTNPRPVGLFTGYVDDDAATAAAMRSDWYFTGDRASKDSDGYIWFEGRSDDVITSSAYRIGPFEVESALVEHPAVAESAVVGKPDVDRTEIVVAFVILASGFKGSDDLVTELQSHCRSLTAPYKYPREIYFVDELPKTISGKIRRSELRAQLRVT